jgi:hypothetical protein
MILGGTLRERLVSWKATAVTTLDATACCDIR